MGLRTGLKTGLKTLILAASLLAPAWSWGHSAMFPDNFKFDDSDEGLPLARAAPSAAATRPVNCSAGLAGDYLCSNIDLQAFMAKSDLSEPGAASANLNDIWGWSDLQTGAEIAIVGRQNGTSFVDVTDPANPVYLGFLASHNGGVDDWRDMKVYRDHAFIVADGFGNRTHGLQVFDLTTLRGVTPGGGRLAESAHFGGFGSAHNIAINRDSGFAYIVGSNQCSGGLYMVDISTPTQPSFAGCFSGDGYTHDAQCVTYRGPDTPFFNREICVAYNEDTITIVDVTDKSNPQQLSRTTYTGSQYTHQGWFLDDNHSHLIMNDELDERRNNHNTTSHIYDVTSLQSPRALGRYVGPTGATDHNLYTRDNHVFESNYRAGLRILDAADIAQGQLREVAYFDPIPCSDSAQFSGTWSSYIYFASGNIVSTDVGNGLFVLSPDWNAIAAVNGALPPPALSPACGGSPAPPPATGGGSSGGGGGGGAATLLLLLLFTRFGASRRRAG